MYAKKLKENFCKYLIKILLYVTEDKLHYIKLTNMERKKVCKISKWTVYNCVTWNKCKWKPKKYLRTIMLQKITE